MSKRVIIVRLICVLLVLYFVSSVYGAYKYLVQYGYGMNELPKTLAVHFGLSKGFTVVEKDEHGCSTFIGDHAYIYEKVFKKNGYYEYDRMGTIGYYNQSGDEKDINGFSIVSSDEWCHWFRIYRISDGYKIEDF